MATKTKTESTEISADRADILFADDTKITNDDAENDNLALYNKVRSVPQEAQKTITGGRLNGFTDINPMWRIKTLTENFGMAGFGWYITIDRMWLENGANDEIAAFAEIDLYVRINDEWSKPIKGVGGSHFISKEHGGLYTSDECFKMALTDAISIACKMLGMGADVYFDKDGSKYDNGNQNETDEIVPDIENMTSNSSGKLTAKQVNRLHAIRKSVNMDEEVLRKIMQKHYSKTSCEELTRSEYDFICGQLEAMQNPA